MTRKIAIRAIKIMILLSIGLAVLNTFIDQSYVGALIGISSASTFYFTYRNPDLLMAKSWNEFDERIHSARDKKYLWGFPAYHAVMLAAILYIWLV